VFLCILKDAAAILISKAAAALFYSELITACYESILPVFYSSGFFCLGQGAE
jgi:hypothetical protein